MQSRRPGSWKKLADGCMMIDTPPPSISITRLSDTSEVPEPQLGPMIKRLKHKDIRRNKPLKEEL